MEFDNASEIARNVLLLGGGNMKKTRLMFGLSAFLLVVMPAHAGEDAQQLKNAAVDMATESVKKELAADADSFPGWLRRTDFIFDFQENNKPLFSLETIQPLYENSLDTIFVQGRAAYSNDDTTLNIGAGYRRLLLDNAFMLGVNSFYDATIHNQHQRWGVGVEAFSQYGTLRGNYYNAVSGTKTANVSGGNTTTEQALDGADVSLETPVPYLPWMLFTGRAFYWDAINVKNIRGWDIGLRMYPFDDLEVEAGFADNNTKPKEAFVTFTWHFGAPDHIRHTAFDTPYSSEFMTARNLEDFRLEKVRRHNDIVIEKKVTNGGISIGRRA